MYVVYTDLQDPGFSLVGIFSTLLRIRTFAKTVVICGDFHAVIWNVENTDTTAELSHLELVKKL